MEKQKYLCNTCEDTGKVSQADGPDDVIIVACPDCELGELNRIDDEYDELDVIDSE